MVNVKLVSYTQPPYPMETLTDLVAYCARVSNPSNQLNNETSDKLINYLMDHKHWSPLEMVNVCLEINTTRDIAHQIVRHRSFSFQEFSQRYADVKNMGEMFVLREARMQDNKNRQNSIELNMNNVLHDKWIKRQLAVRALAEETYNWAIHNGIAKEQARVVLPEGLTKSKLYMNGTLRSWVHYVDLRTTKGTQKEHLIIAQECGDIIKGLFPVMNKFIHSC
jgi:thymidylate synthase (FAD)